MMMTMLVPCLQDKARTRGSRAHRHTWVISILVMGLIIIRRVMVIMVMKWLWGMMGITDLCLSA